MAALVREAFSKQNFDIGTIGRSLKRELLHDHCFNAECFNKELGEAARGVSKGIGLLEQRLALDKNSLSTQCACLKSVIAQSIEETKLTLEGSLAGLQLGHEQRLGRFVRDPEDQASVLRESQEQHRRSLWACAKRFWTCRVTSRNSCVCFKLT